MLHNVLDGISPLERRPMLRAKGSPWTDSVQFLLRDGKAVGTNVIMETIEDAAVPLQPTMELSIEAAQVLMDDLWLAGLRPSEGTGSAGAMSATQKHLEDMRKIAFAKIGVEGGAA